MKYTIEDLRNGKCAVIHDGTLKQLQEVIKLAFPKSTPPSGNSTYYFKDNYNDSWDYDVYSDLPKQSVKDFLKSEIVWGEEVEAKLVKGANFGTMQYYYVSTNPLKNADNKHIVVSKLGNALTVFDVRRIEIKDVELTMQEIADKFKIDVTRLKVKQ